MKKICFLIFFIFVVQNLFSAPRAKIDVMYVTPDYLAKTSALTADSSVTTGMKVVPNKVYVYFSVRNFGDTSSIINANWVLLSKPAGSSATLSPVPALNWMKLRPDSTGTYTVQVTITTSSGTKDTTMSIYSANYVGTGGFANVPAVYPNCMSCHAAMPTFQAIFDRWKVSGHANIFRYEIDSGAAYYGISCIKCHTTGYDHNIFADNNGFDDKARTLGWSWSNWAPPKPGNWDSLRIKYPSLVAFASIGCENCHGPGSEHVKGGGDTNKVDLKVSPGKCGQCHDEPWRHDIFAQWKNAVHANPIFEGRNVSARNSFDDCNRCHDGKSYVDFTYDRVRPPNLTTADQEVIGCASCHDPHGNTNEYSLRNRPLNSDTLATGYHYAGGTGKVCLDCHKARRNNVTYVQTRVTNSVWGPHHSTQGDVLLGKNAAVFSVPYISGSHSNISNACVTCHMAQTTDTGTVTRDKVGGHSLNLHYAPTNYDHVKGCLSCHPGVVSFDDFIAPSDFDGDGIVEPWQQEIAGCIRNLRIALPPVGLDSVSWQLIAADSNNVNLRKAYWNYQLISNDGSLGMHNPFFAVNVLLASIANAVGIENKSVEIPVRYELSQNYPNPFNPTTKIDFSIPRAELVTIKIYDITGREIFTLVNEKLNAGKYTVTWNAYGTKDGVAPSGVYFYRITAGTFVETKKMVLIK